jgi:hypothetical protein
VARSIGQGCDTRARRGGEEARMRGEVAENTHKRRDKRVSAFTLVFPLRAGDHALLGGRLSLARDKIGYACA